MFRPNREFQAGLNQKESRRQREQKSLSLRRKDRELKLQIKRKKILNNIKNNNNATVFTSQALLQELPRYVKGCFTNHKVSIYDCCKKIRELLSVSTNSVPIKQVIDSGVIQRIVQLLRWNDCPQIQFECMWILTNIVSSDKPEYTATVVRNGAIPLISNILKIQKYPLQEQAIWALGNIAGECTELRDLIVNTGVLSLLVSICKNGLNDDNYWPNDSKNKSSGQAQYLSLLCTLSWALSNLCRNYNGTNENTRNKGMYSAVIECTFYLFLYNKSFCDEEISQNIGWIYCYLTTHQDFTMANNLLLNGMNECGITNQLVELLNNDQESVYRPCLKALGNILAGNDVYTQKCIDCGVLQSFYNLFKKSKLNHNQTALKEWCWSISNITAGSKEQIAAVVSCQLFPILCQLIKNAPSFVAGEALWSLANATCFETSSQEIIYYLCDEENGCNLIQSLCIYNKNNFVNKSYFKSMNKILTVSLECIENILVIDKKFALLFELHGGVDFLEYIQTIESISQEIYDKTIAIIQQHFNDDNNDANIINNENIDLSFNDAHNDRPFSNQFGFGVNNTNNNNGSTFQF